MNDARPERPAAPPSAPDASRRTYGFKSLLLTGVADVWTGARASLHGRGDALGLLLMVVSAAAFALMAALVKVHLPNTPVQAAVFSRGVMMTLVFGTLAAAKGVRLRGNRPTRLALRGILGYVAVSCYFVSVKRLPIGDAVLIQYSHPVFVSALAPFLLKERTGRGHWPLVAAAFLGVALVAGPSGGFREGAGVGLLGAAMSGFAYMTVRDLSRTEHPLAILTWFSGVMAIGAGVWLAADWRAAIPADWHEVGGHLAVTASALVGQFALTHGLARAGAARATAVSMAGPAFGLSLDWWFFARTPGVVSLAGTAITMTALALLAWSRPSAGADATRPSA